ncbi:MAG TPA: hypothetical protein DEF12_03050 [Rhodobacteraceae bacterium]|nr:hypothetical protein [Paracoccaceae bacterium]
MGSVTPARKRAFLLRVWLAEANVGALIRITIDKERRSPLRIYEKTAVTAKSITTRVGMDRLIAERGGLR